MEPHTSIAKAVKDQLPDLKADLARLVRIPSVTAPGFPEPRAWEGKPPVGIKLLIEGQEEVGSPLETPAELAPFTADAMLIADGGNIRPGAPSLTVALRGDAVVTVEARTLAGPKDSGQFGGAAPDALIALLHALASLHDEHGDVAVEGLRRDAWTGASWTDDEFRQLAEVEQGMPPMGTGPTPDRVWSGPAITVIGIDAPPVDEAVNAVSAYARARLNVRVHPEQDAAEAQAAVIRHLEVVRPFGISLRAEAGATGDGFAAPTSGPAYQSMADAMGMRLARRSRQFRRDSGSNRSGWRHWEIFARLRREGDTHAETSSPTPSSLRSPSSRAASSLQLTGASLAFSGLRWRHPLEEG